ncbi:hypothetical protein [Streptomyces sp. NPDC046805]|uniref:hypothetical protein n=1 Tax=Streptomyces sp. NPDC046805 TaxID=3155134 RepID=UPI0033DE1E64
MAVHLIGPVLVCLGLGLTYISAFHHPEPNDLRVAVVGTSPKTKVMAQTIKDKGGDHLDVVTVPTRHAAKARLMDRDIVGALVPSSSHPELLVAKADSNATANATVAVFQTVTDKQHVPLKVTDVAPPAEEDPNGGGLFFLLIALTVSSYISVLTMAPAAGMLGMHVRAALGLGVSLAISGIGILLAGPVFDVVDHSQASVWAVCLLYSAGVVAVGLGLQTFLKQLTPLVLMGLFVMLNLTSAGGLMGPQLQNGFYGALHSFWNGAGFVEGARSILYFDDNGLSSHLLTLWLWLAAGVALMLLAALVERRRKPLPQPVPQSAEVSAVREPYQEGGPTSDNRSVVLAE